MITTLPTQKVSLVGIVSQTKISLDWWRKRCKFSYTSYTSNTSKIFTRPSPREKITFSESTKKFSEIESITPNPSVGSVGSVGDSFLTGCIVETRAVVHPHSHTHQDIHITPYAELRDKISYREPKMISQSDSFRRCA